MSEDRAMSPDRCAHECRLDKTDHDLGLVGHRWAAPRAATPPCGDSNHAHFQEWLDSRAAPRAATEPPLTRERLAAALHGAKQCDFGYCEGPVEHEDEAQGILDELRALAALTSTSAPEPGS